MQVAFFKHAFEACDADKSGTVERTEIAKMIRDYMPDATKSKKAQQEIIDNVAECERQAFNTQEKDSAEELSSVREDSSRQYQDAATSRVHSAQSALARAASVKELERTSAAATGEKLLLKLEQAGARRTELNSPREESLEKAAERARQVVTLKRELELKTEEKRRQLSRALERASEKRDSLVQGIAAKAGASNARVAQTAADVRDLAESGDRSARRCLFGKLNEAEVRAKLHQASRASAKPSVLLEIQVHSASPPAAPAALVARLSAATARSAEGYAEFRTAAHAAATKRAAALAAARGEAVPETAWGTGRRAGMTRCSELLHLST